MYIYIFILVIFLILMHRFKIYMKEKYDISSEEFQYIKEKNIKRNIYYNIILGIALFVIILWGKNCITIFIAISIIVLDFIYGLSKIKKLGEYKYTLYYIVYELIFSICFSLALMILFI